MKKLSKKNKIGKYKAPWGTLGDEAAIPYNPTYADYLGMQLKNAADVLGTNIADWRTALGASATGAARALGAYGSELGSIALNGTRAIATAIPQVATAVGEGLSTAATTAAPAILPVTMTVAAPAAAGYLLYQGIKNYPTVTYQSKEVPPPVEGGIYYPGTAEYEDFTTKHPEFIKTPVHVTPIGNNTLLMDEIVKTPDTTYVTTPTLSDPRYYSPWGFDIHIGTSKSKTAAPAATGEQTNPVTATEENSTTTTTPASPQGGQDKDKNSGSNKSRARRIAEMLGWWHGGGAAGGAVLETINGGNPWTGAKKGVKWFTPLGWASMLYSQIPDEDEDKKEEKQEEESVEDILNKIQLGQ